MSRLRIGIISFAHLHAHDYARLLNDLHEHELEFIGVYDDDAQRGQQAAALYNTRFHADYRQLLSMADGVIICSENQSHARYATAAANVGVHLLVEKPLTTEGSEARTLIELCEAQHVQLLTAFPVRMNTSIQQAKQRIESGEIGRILAVSATNRSKMPGGWFVDATLSGGGAVLDHTVHVLDVLRWMLGSEVREVYAEIGTLLHNIPVEDCGLLSMIFENEVIATLDTSWSRSHSFPVWSDVTMRIIGEIGVIHLDMYKQSGELWDDSATCAHRYVKWNDNEKKALLFEFLDCIIHRRKPFITGEDGLRAAEVAWAAYTSVHTGQPVRIQHY